MSSPRFVAFVVAALQARIIAPKKANLLKALFLFSQHMHKTVSY